jgi:hypothetical protein
VSSILLVLLTSAVAAIGIVAGSIPGSGRGQTALFTGAILGGIIATIGAAWRHHDFG